MKYISISDAERQLNPYLEEVGEVFREFLEKAGWVTRGRIWWYLIPTELGLPHVKLSKVKGYASKFLHKDLVHLYQDRNDLFMEIVNKRQRKKAEFEQAFTIYYMRKQSRYAPYMLSDVKFPSRDDWESDLRKHQVWYENRYRRKLGLQDIYKPLDLPDDLCETINKEII